MSNQPIVPEEFNAEKISFSEPKKQKTRDGKSTITRAYMLYDDKLRYWESPWIRAPFGVNAFEAKEGESSNYSLNVSGRAVDPKDQELVDHWFEQWMKVDKKFTDYLVENSKTTLGKQYKPAQREVVEALQSRMVKHGDEDENGVPYPPRIAPKIGKDMENQDKPAVAVYLDSEDDQDVGSFEELKNLVPKGSRVRLIIQPKLWFISGKAGISCRVVQIQVQPTGGARLQGFSFSKGEMPAVGASAEDGEAEAEAEATGETEEEVDTTQVEDSGEEVEEVVEEEDDFEG